MAQGLINDYHLTDIANAIRNKNGTLNSYLPSEFAAQIRALANDGYSEFEKAIMRNLGEIYDTTTTEVGASAYYNSDELTSVTFTEATYLGNSAFYSCDKLQYAYFPKVTRTGYSVLGYCKALTEVKFESEVVFGSSVFEGDSALVKADFVGRAAFGSMCFYGCSQLTTLILRGSTVSAPTMGSGGYASSVFNNTPIAKGTGYIYVPSALLSTYKSHAYWKTYSARFRAIESYPSICG